MATNRIDSLDPALIRPGKKYFYSYSIGMHLLGRCLLESVVKLNLSSVMCFKQSFYGFAP